MKICQYFKSISISLSPNTEKDDILLALKLIFQPWKWKIKNLKKSPGGQKFNFLDQLENEFKKYLGLSYVYSFNSGRSALMAILRALEIGDTSTGSAQSEVLIQGFTCNSVPNAILWMGGKPVYVDIDKSLNLDPKDLERKITPKSKAIIIQHTFGQPAQIDKILEIAKNHNLKVIEDCAHSLGATYKDRLIGSWGDISFFSFGRDKIISSVYGGMAVTNNLEIAKKLEKFQKNCPYPSNFWIIQQLLHPIIFSIALPTYYFLNFGKFLIWFSQKLKLLSKAVTKEEKQGKNPSYFPQRMPEALTQLALNQFKKLDRFNEHRREIAEFYNANVTCPTSPWRSQGGRANEMPASPAGRRMLRIENSDSDSIYWKYPIFIENAKEITEKLKKEHIVLYDGWQGTPVVPPGTNLEKMRYKLGDCPKAEKIAKTIVNLPTHINISFKDAQKIVKCIKSLK